MTSAMNPEEREALQTAIKRTMDKPCWLTPDQLEEAEVLIDLNFSYIGNADDYSVEEHLKFAKVGSWNFYGCAGECFLDAVCNGALYSKNLELEEEKTLGAEEELRKIKVKLRSIQKKRNDARPRQLSLF